MGSASVRIQGVITLTVVLFWGLLIETVDVAASDVHESIEFLSVSVDEAVCEVPAGGTIGIEQYENETLFFVTSPTQSQETFVDEPGADPADPTMEEPKEERKIYINRCPTKSPHSAEASTNYSYLKGDNGGTEIEDAIRAAQRTAKDKLPKECAFHSGDECRICDKDVNVEGRCTRTSRTGVTEYEDSINQTDDGEKSGRVQGTVTSIATKHCNYACK